MKKGNQKCTTQELKILGDYWTLAIIQALEERAKRFCEIEREVTKVNPTTLTNRLKKLESQKIIKRKEETVDKISVVYSLTEKGRAIVPILNEIQSFADRYL